MEMGNLYVSELGAVIQAHLCVEPQGAGQPLLPG